LALRPVLLRDSGAAGGEAAAERFLILNDCSPLASLANKLQFYSKFVFVWFE
jgi:hypothetical protein